MQPADEYNIFFLECKNLFQSGSKFRADPKRLFSRWKIDDTDTVLTEAAAGRRSAAASVPTGVAFLLASNKPAAPGTTRNMPGREGKPQLHLHRPPAADRRQAADALREDHRKPNGRK